VELLVVLAILAIVAGLSSVALRRIEAAPPGGVADELRALRRHAIRSGRAQTRTIRQDGMLHVVTALADGRMRADPPIALDPSTGEVRDAAQ
jgi:hypothetical protein